MSERPAVHPPRILVLLAIRNGAEWLPEQVSSICAQRGVVPVIAVCDDGSTDGSLDMVANQCRGRVDCQVIQSSLPGGSASANFFRLIQAVEASTFDYVALADQDDVWGEGKLSTAVDRLQSTGAHGYSSAVDAFWPDGHSARLTQAPTPTAIDYLYEGFGQGCTFVMCHSFFVEAQRIFAMHRHLLAKIHYHDWALYALSRSTGRQWTFDDRASMRYRQHSVNDTGARSGTAGISKRVALIRSGWYARQVLAMSILCAAVEDPGKAKAADNLRMLERAGRETSARVLLACRLATRGRRRAVDRLVLFVAALGGYLHA